MLPPETLSVLEGEIREGRAPMHEIRLEDRIIRNAETLPGMNSWTSTSLMR